MRRNTLVILTLFLAALSCQAQEKVMNVLKTDGTTTQTRVAELKQISFLAVEKGNQGLLLTTVGGETATVLFEANPVVTISSGKLTIKSDTEDAITFEVTDIAEIQFGDAATGIGQLQAFTCVVQDGGTVLRGIPDGVRLLVYSIDGRSVPAPAICNGELRLSRATLGKGIFIVKVGTFSTKIQL